MIQQDRSCSYELITAVLAGVGRRSRRAACRIRRLPEAAGAAGQVAETYRFLNFAYLYRIVSMCYNAPGSSDAILWIRVRALATGDIAAPARGYTAVACPLLAAGGRR